MIVTLAPKHLREEQPEGEDNVILKILETIQAKYEKDYPAGAGPMLRHVHRKSHGLVSAELVVGDDVPPHLRYGLFAQPGSYPAWIRFSNGSTLDQPDSKPDVRGAAIKVMNVPGNKVHHDELGDGSQDFLMAGSYSEFFVKNAADYLELTEKLEGGLPLSFFFGLNPLKWRLREFKNMLMSMVPKVVSPLAIQYWSQVSYALGPVLAVKLSLSPHAEARDCTNCASIPPSRNYLREAMAQHLHRAEAGLDLLVQVQSIGDKMPVEDPTVRWDEQLSPYLKVATLRVLQQTFDTPELNQRAEELSFSPWHTLPEHRPLGGINRVRRMVYQALSDLRRRRNGAAR